MSKNLLRASYLNMLARNPYSVLAVTMLARLA